MECLYVEREAKSHPVKVGICIACRMTLSIVFTSGSVWRTLLRW